MFVSCFSYLFFLGLDGGQPCAKIPPREQLHLALLPGLLASQVLELQSQLTRGEEGQTVSICLVTVAVRALCVLLRQKSSLSGRDVLHVGER